MRIRLFSVAAEKPLILTGYQPIAGAVLAHKQEAIVPCVPHTGPPMRVDLVKLEAKEVEVSNAFSFVFLWGEPYAVTLNPYTEEVASEPGN